jgi:hypothetical protein
VLAENEIVLQPSGIADGIEVRGNRPEFFQSLFRSGE